MSCRPVPILNEAGKMGMGELGSNRDAERATLASRILAER